MCYCRFRRQVPEGFRRVAVCVGVGTGGRFRKDPRCGLLLCHLIRGSHLVVLNTFW